MAIGEVASPPAEPTAGTPRSGPPAWHGLRPARALMVLTSAFIAAALAGWVAFAFADRAETLAEAEDQLTLIARLLAGHTQRTIEGSDLVLRQLERDIETRGIVGWTSRPGAWRVLQKAGEWLPQIGDIYVMGADGRVLAHSMGPQAIPGDFSDRGYFRAHSAGRGDSAYVGRRLTGRFTDIDFFSITRRLDRPDGSFGGVIVAAIHVSYFQRFHLGLGMPEGSSIAILRSDGAVLSREPPVAGVVRLPAQVAGLTPDSPASFGLWPGEGADGREMVARRLVEGYPVVVMAARAERSILAGWRSRLVEGSSFVAVLTLAVGALAWLGMRGLRRQEEMGAALRRSNETLEQRVLARTAELVASNQALADKNVLLSEVHHRVKNNLQLIEALLALQSARAPEAARAALDQARGRINALGLVHQQLLGAGDLATVREPEFLRDLCGRIALSFGAAERGLTLTVAGDDAPLSPDLAIPLGLVVNEVLSNAFKHAFPDGRAGAIRVTLTRGSEALRLVVHDTGVGQSACGGDGPRDTSGLEAAVQSRAHLGDRIIRSLVRQMRGTLSVDSTDGTRVEITVPVKEAQDAP